MRNTIASQHKNTDTKRRFRVQSVPVVFVAGTEAAAADASADRRAAVACRGVMDSELECGSFLGIWSPIDEFVLLQSFGFEDRKTLGIPMNIFTPTYISSQYSISV
jgi:hypothetical protein